MFLYPYSSEIFSFHGAEDDSVVILGCNAE